jgi:hypothetical protein
VRNWGEPSFGVVICTSYRVSEIPFAYARFVDLRVDMRLDLLFDLPEFLRAFRLGDQL